VSRLIETGSTVKCIMFSLKTCRQIHAITLNQAMTNLLSSLIIHIALVILSLCTVSSEQMTVLLNKSYTIIWLHFQIQNNLISCLSFFVINTSKFSSPFSWKFYLNFHFTWSNVTINGLGRLWKFYLLLHLGIHTICRVTAYLPLCQRLPVYETETEFKKCSLIFTYLQKCL